MTSFHIETDKPGGTDFLLAGIAPEIVEEAVVPWLRERGWICEKPENWELPNQFCARIGINIFTLSRKLEMKNCPPVGVERGKQAVNGRKGRLLWIAPTPEFIRFCKAYGHRPKPTSRGGANEMDL